MEGGGRDGCQCICGVQCAGLSGRQAMNRRKRSHCSITGAGLKDCSVVVLPELRDGFKGELIVVEGVD